MNNDASVENGEPKQVDTKKKREIKPILIHNIPYFLFGSFFILMMVVAFSEGVKSHGPVFIPMPFIFFILLITAIMGGTYLMKYVMKFEYNFSDAPILPKNWSQYFPNNWEAIKSNSMIVMFVFFCCSMLAGAFMEHRSTFIQVMTWGFLAFVIPPLTIYFLMKWKKMKYLAIGNMKLEAGPFTFTWFFFLIILLKLLQVLKQQKILLDPLRIKFGFTLVVIAYVAIIIMALKQKNED